MSQTTTCRACGASLAPDQRYCLSCGTRVSSPRLDFLAEYERQHGAAQSNGQAPSADAGTAGGPAALLNGSANSATAPTATTAAAPSTVATGGSSRLDRVGGPMGAAAVVLVALGIGFLIGQSGNDSTPVAQRAPVVNIQGGLPTSAPAAAPTTTPDASATGADSGGAAGGDSGSSSSPSRSRGSTRSGAASAADARSVEDSIRNIPKTDTSTAGGDLNRLRAQPDETATEGPPPPKDNKAPGGGGRATVIG